MLDQLHKTYHQEVAEHLEQMKLDALHNKNIFESLMDVAKYASLGQITEALFKVGGQYRRNM